MVKNRFLLSSVAFAVSFVLSLFVNRDIKTALSTGLITVTATFSGIVVVNRKQKTQHKSILNELEIEIYQLERWETQLNQSLTLLVAEKQRTEANINFLQTELRQLYTQTAEQRSCNQQLSQDLITFIEQKQRLEAELDDLETQIQNLEQRKEELYHSLRSIKAEKQNAEAGFNSMQAELKQLQLQIAEQQHQKQELENNLILLNRLKPHLEEKLHNLRSQIQVLEKSQAELNQSLAALAQERHTTEIHINLLQTQLSQLQSQLLETQKNQDKIGDSLGGISEEKHKLEAEYNQTENLPDEWAEFVTRLPTSEVQVLKAIIQESEPRHIIKRIAEENITMPELLIDSINKYALDIIGDLLIEPGSGAVPPKIIEEYLKNVNKIIKIKETN